MDDIWRDRARLLRVMAHPARLAILEALAGGSRCVKDINSLIPVSQPHLSQHMTALREAQLIAFHTDGPLRCYYVLRPVLVRGLIRLLRGDHEVRYRDRVAVQREAKRASSATREE